MGDIPLWLQPCWYHTARQKTYYSKQCFLYIHLDMSKIEIALEFFCSIRLWDLLGNFLEIVEGFNLVLVALGKGSCRVWNLGKFLEGSIYFWVLLEKGVVEFQIYFFLGEATLGKGSLQIWDCSWIIFWRIFIGGKPWKMQSGDLRLLWNYFSIFFYGASLEKCSLEIWDLPAQCHSSVPYW